MYVSPLKKVMKTEKGASLKRWFAEDWKDAHYEKGETQSFYNDFFKVFGRQRHG